MTFEELDLNDNVLDALYDMRFETCTPIQEHCIPQILEGKDILGVAQTGTGKTAAYLLPIMSMLDDGGFPHDAINCIIMSPTRELAQQIDQAMQGFGYYLDSVSSLAIYGGNEIAALRGRYHHRNTWSFHLTYSAWQRGFKQSVVLCVRRSRPYARHGFLGRHHDHCQTVATNLPNHYVLGHDAT